jgi:hypothetical protein
VNAVLRVLGDRREALVERTLARAAQARRRRELKVSRVDALVDVTRQLAGRLTGPFAAVFVSVTVGLIPIFFPIGFHFSIFDDTESARSYLSALWQVAAVTIALSLTLILVVFEAIFRARFRGSGRRLTEETRILYAVSAAFAALVVIGVVLLGYGHEAPAGWAATWATAFAALAFAAVPLLLIRTLAWMNPATPHEQRLAQIRAETYDAVDEEAFERLAYGVLKERTSAAGIELDMFRMAPAFDQRVEVGAADAGIVRDIRLSRLERVARNLTKKQRGALAITTYLGQYVARSERVAVLPASASAREVRRVEKAFGIDTQTRISRLYGVIGHLHDEALRTIREVKPSEYDGIAELWAELLLALPRAWSRYGLIFDETVAGEMGRFGFGPTDAAARNLYAAAREARRSTPDLAAEAFMLPDRIATRALDLDAPALLVRMLALYTDLYSLAAETEDERLRERLLHLVLELPPQLGRRIEHDFRRLDLSDDERRRVERNLRIVFRTLAELMKAVMDHDPHDLGRISKVNSSWTDLFAGWQPEHDRPIDWGTAGETPEQRADREARTLAVDRLVISKGHLDDYRDAYRLMLAWWALYRLEQTADASWACIAETLSLYFGSVEQLAQATDEAIKVARDENVILHWHGGNISDDLALTRTFLILSLLRFEPAHFPDSLGECGFLRHMRREVEDMLGAVASTEELWGRLSRPSDLNERVETLRGLVRGD